MSQKYPVIPQIRNIENMKTAFNNIRAYFSDLVVSEQAASQSTAQRLSPVLAAINLAASDFVLDKGNSFRFLEVSTGSATHAIVAPNTPGREYVVINNDGANSVKIKVSGGTGVTIAASKRATVYCNGTDYVRVTGDQ